MATLQNLTLGGIKRSSMRVSLLLTIFHKSIILWSRIIRNKYKKSYFKTFNISWPLKIKLKGYNSYMYHPYYVFYKHEYEFNTIQ